LPAGIVRELVLDLRELEIQRCHHCEFERAEA
jgi:hypothetical protein